MSDCCQESGLLPFEQAKRRLLESLTPTQQQVSIKIADGLGRILSAPVCAQVDVPPMDNSGMDGYAVRAADLQENKQLTLVGRSFAGHPFIGTVTQGQCVRIMTGAKIPAGADTVVMQEKTQVEGDSILFCETPKTSDHIRRKGEAITRGAVVFQPGHQLKAPDIGLLASLGVGEVKVYQKLKVALLSTGDELKPAGSELAEGEIYESNSYALASMLQRLPVEVLNYGNIPDVPEQIEQTLRQASLEADVIITSGGVSVGEADYVKDILEQLGQIHFWKLAIKPGKPFTFGRINNAVFLGLPGNPVSAMVTFYLLGVPALQTMMGQTITAPLRLKAILEDDLRKKPGRMDFQRGLYFADEQGQLHVKSAANQGSGVLTSMSIANCFIVLSQASGNAVRGDEVMIEPFAGVLCA